jgi:hypothetical protein
MSMCHATHASRSHAIRIAGPPEQVFPLFTPLGEKAWAAEWDPEILYPPDGAPQVGAVFTVPHATGGRAVWTIAAYDPARYQITYVAVVPDERISRIEIQCRPDADGTTQAEVAYTHTALSAAGNAYLATQTDEFHRRRIDSWKAAIDHYLAHGHAVAHH